MELSNRENWRSIDGYLNYEVSDVGRIRNVNTGKILKQYFASSGYYKVSLCGKGKVKQCFVHKLVAREFIENLSNKPIADHIDGHKTNNCVSNLRWATKSENNMNQKPQQKAKYSRYKGVSFHKLANKWRAYVNKNGKRTELGLFIDEKEAAQKYNEVAIRLFGEFALLNKIEN